jgi:heme acquisition protein HasA
VELSISGLDVWSDVSRSTTHLLQDQDTQDVQDLGIYNLLKGNANPLLNILQSQGISVDTPLKDMAIASQFDVIADAPIIDIVGENDGSDILLVA